MSRQESAAPVPVLGVSACLLDAAGEAVLLVERGRPPFAGLLSLPGGRVGFGETLEAAVRREIAEETALIPDALAFLRLHEAIDAENGVHAVIAVFAGALPAGAVPRAGDDAASLCLVPLADLADLACAARLTPGLEPVVAEALTKICREAPAQSS